MNIEKVVVAYFSV